MAMQETRYAWSESGLGSLYDQIGGARTIEKLVEAFYPRVYRHPELRPLFPDGVEAIKAKQLLFLTQFTGGPALYTDKYGFGNMKLMHERFEITPQRADAWLTCMREAMDDIGLGGHARTLLYQLLDKAAHRFVNADDSSHRQ